MHLVATATSTTGGRAALFVAAIIMVAGCGPQQTSGSGTATYAVPSPSTHPASSGTDTTQTSGGVICRQSGTEDVCEWPSPSGSQLFDLTTRQP